MKYVAFIDTLGFQQRISKILHEEAVQVIKQFNQSIYNLWMSQNLRDDHSIKGRTFSDSFIIHSSNDSIEELRKILNFLSKLYRISITESDFLLRGGISKGNFDDLDAREFKNLNKELIVGTAFIEAYLLESSNNIKGSKLLFGNEIKQIIENEIHDFETQKVKKDKSENPIYELKWGDILYLRENDFQALKKFVDLASESNWLDHYYGTLETFLINESKQNKSEIFIRIIDRLKTKYKYFDLDNFIENYLKSESATYTKRSFLAFLREKI